MPNGPEHRLSSGLGVFLGWAAYELQTKGELSWKTPAAGAIGFASGTLPDILEPATRGPRHRQFFHSIGFGMALGYGLNQLWKWQPEQNWQQLAKAIGLVVGAAYIIHLVMDARTPNSLPLIGKI